ncbi:hypothetical protein PR048_029048 [Dryococelus australis]|uniref:N-terminal Ras-GEF domain-containing protein n=1 Tax=Dryococelus australis TaxID=614101 RepID=A0ABQ9GC93_9NEOP|nr:hypothetical protein PR048_029048 [Dryococelus australis]
MSAPAQGSNEESRTKVTPINMPEPLSRIPARHAYGGRGGVVVRLLASHLCEQSSIPGEAAPGFLQVGIVPDDPIYFANNFTISLDLRMNKVTTPMGRGKREIPEKTRRPTASSGTIPTCENPVTRPGIEPGFASVGGERANRSVTMAPLPEATNKIINLRVTRSLFLWANGTWLVWWLEKTVHVASRNTAEIRSLAAGRDLAVHWKGLFASSLFFICGMSGRLPPYAELGTRGTARTALSLASFARSSFSSCMDPAGIVPATPLLRLSLPIIPPSRNSTPPSVFCDCTRKGGEGCELQRDSVIRPADLCIGETRWLGFCRGFFPSTPTPSCLLLYVCRPPASASSTDYVFSLLGGCFEVAGLSSKPSPHTWTIIVDPPLIGIFNVHLGELNSIPGGVATGFSYVGIVPLHSGAASLITSLHPCQPHTSLLPVGHVSFCSSSFTRNSATHSFINSNATPGSESCCNFYRAAVTISKVQHTPSYAERTSCHVVLPVLQALVYRDGGNLVSGSLDALVQHMVPTADYYPDRAYLFAFLLSSRLFVKPHELLGEVCALCDHQQKLSDKHAPAKVGYSTSTLSSSYHTIKVFRQTASNKGTYLDDHERRNPAEAHRLIGSGWHSGVAAFRQHLTTVIPPRLQGRANRKRALNICGGVCQHIQDEAAEGPAAPILADQQARLADVRRGARQTHPRRREDKPSQTANIFSTSYGAVDFDFRSMCRDSRHTKKILWGVDLGLGDSCLPSRVVLDPLGKSFSPVRLHGGKGSSPESGCALCHGSFEEGGGRWEGVIRKKKYPGEEGSRPRMMAPRLPPSSCSLSTDRVPPVTRSFTSNWTSNYLSETFRPPLSARSRLRHSSYFFLLSNLRRIFKESELGWWVWGGEWGRLRLLSY